jgi:fucose permease
MLENACFWNIRFVNDGRRAFCTDTEIAKIFFISGGLFLSIMWPSIFDLAIAGLERTQEKLPLS